MAVMRRDARRRGQLFVLLAVLAWSTNGVLQRELRVDTATQVAGRAFSAFLFITAVVLFSSRGRVLLAVRSIGAGGVAVAICTGFASGSFIIALNHAKVANVLLIQAVAPIAAALLAWAALRERVTGRSWLAMVASVLGVALMVGAPGSGGGFGIAVSLLSAMAFAGVIVITRHRRDVSMLPAVGLSQLLVLLASAPFADAGSVSGRNVILLVLLGVAQVGLGLIFFTLGARLLPAAEVALITLLEIVLAPLWVWVSISETPAMMTLVGGAVVMAAVVFQATRGDSEPASAGPLAARKNFQNLASDESRDLVASGPWSPES
jgi:drug/metabolite transporter (DMT)-like permease